MQIVVSQPLLAPPRPATAVERKDSFAEALLRADIAAEAWMIESGCQAVADRLHDFRRDAQDLYREIIGRDMP